MKTSIKNINGANCILIDGEPIDSLAFKSFRPTTNNVSDFYRAGVRIFNVFCSGLRSGLQMPYSLFGETWFGDKEYDFKNLDDQIEFFRKNAPDAYLFINVHLDSREWWHEENEGRSPSFTHLSQIAGDEKWRSDTADYLKALIAHVEEKYNDCVCGYFLLGGHTTEWFSDRDYQESHPIKLKAFQKYMGDDELLIPTTEAMEKPSSQIFLDPDADRAIIDYQKFHNRLITDTVLYFAHEAQTVLNHQKLVGMFFGYIMELHGERLWNAGHIDFDRLYRSPDVDLLATPSSYQFRKHEDAGAHMLLCETLELNGVFYFNSFDHTTCTFPTLLENERRLCTGEDTMVAMRKLQEMRKHSKENLLTEEKTIDAMRREFMMRLSKRTGMWWFDMLEGWFYNDALMQEIQKNAEISQKYMEVNRDSNSEIAVLISNDSMYYVNKHSDINSETICNQREGLSKIGAPFDMFSFNDVERLDKNRYKLYVFVNVFSMTDEQREYVNREIKANGRSLLFIGSTDYVDESGFSKEKLERMTGFSLDLLASDEKEIRAYGSSYGYEKAKSPTWYVCDEKAEILGRYADSKRCGLAKKSFGDYTAYYSGLGNLSAGALREIAREAGVHIYAENNVAVYINRGFVGVYNTASEYTEIDLARSGRYKEIFTDRLYSTEDGKITLPTGESPAQMLVLEE